jgi:crotonobetainyl-CoA:carnitine CoA-transferase CaiB-like acyl-CoA transferase
VAGPHLDSNQTGYGPGYRIHEAADGEWLAVVIPDSDAWKAAAEVLNIDLPDAYIPLRTGEDDVAAEEAEKLITGAIASRPADEWVDSLRSAGVLVELVRIMNRDEFRKGILDDPVNLSLGRVAEYSTSEWGDFQQIGPLLRLGPDEWSGPSLNLPSVGEHTSEVLAMVGVEQELLADMLESGIAVQGRE